MKFTVKDSIYDQMMSALRRARALGQTPEKFVLSPTEWATLKQDPRHHDQVETAFDRFPMHTPAVEIEAKINHAAFIASEVRPNDPLGGVRRFASHSTFAGVPLYIVPTGFEPL